MLVAAVADALRTRVRDEAGRARFFRTSFIGSDAGAMGVAVRRPAVPAESASAYPVAYRIELDPGSDLDVHFHHANQFQIFLAGAGHLGRHAVQAVTVHYAGAWTAYGPIRPGPGGLSFMTLRDAWDPGARFLPEHKDALRLARQPRREALAAPLPGIGTERIAGPRDARLLGSDTDTMGAWVLERPPGAPVEPPAAAALAASGGGFWLVLDGALQLDGRPAPLPALSCLHLDADDAPPAARAAPGGLRLLLLRFPRRLPAG
jgi:hypothetical protein